jgi:hypothetical protein
MSTKRVTQDVVYPHSLPKVWAALTDVLYDFVTDPRASRNARPVMQELHSFVPEMVSVLEHMILDGVEERKDVADYVNFVFGH